MSAGSEVVERALALSSADGCVVLVEESSSANLRWAGNSLTTNGAVRGRSISVISIVGESVGVRSAAVADDLEGLVKASEQAARDAAPAEDAGPLVTGPAAPDFAEPAVEASPAVFGSLARELGQAFGAARTDGIALYGYASHDLTTLWLGSSTGLRLRHVQPTGYVEVTGKSTGGSSWVGQHTRDWSDVDVGALDGELRRRLGWGARQVELPAGRYETLLPPSAVADLMAYAYWTASAAAPPRAGRCSAVPAAAPGSGSTSAPPGCGWARTRTTRRWRRPRSSWPRRRRR
jgi:predicted Zn-dependent protease